MVSGPVWKRAALCFLLVLTACGDSTGPTTGSLNLTVSGLPANAEADINVTGPNGFDRRVIGSQTLAGLPDGIYTVAARAVTVNSTGYAPNPATQTVPVGQGSGAAFATVSYAVASGSLAVTVTGLAPGTDAAITVTGPEGYQEFLTGSVTLTDLVPGPYTLTAVPVSEGAEQYNPSPASQTATVTGGGTASATVSYSTGSNAGFNLRIDGAYLVQSVQRMSGAVPLVRGRDALLRVFVTANQLNAAAPKVRVRLYSGGVLASTTQINAPGLSTPQTPAEGSLNSSWNLLVSGSLIQPGLSVLVDVDPDNLIAEANEGDNQFPSAGTPLALDVRVTGQFNVRFVPVVTSADNRQGNVTDGNKAQFMAVTMKMHPVAGYDADVRAPYTTTTTLPLQHDNGNGAWNAIVAEIYARRQAETTTRYYYGVVNPPYTSGVAGVGYVGGPAAVGWDKLPSGSSVAAHEWGHNWGRNHAPCGDAPNPDANYPYAGGVIGVIGYDVAAAQLKPADFHDLMGYCGNEWISDYTYTGVLDYRSTGASVASGAGGAVQPALLVWGRIENGRAVLEPAFQITARPSLPRGGGPYRLEGRRVDGSAVFGFDFTPLEVADDRSGGKHFAFAVPLSPDRAARLNELRLEGAGVTAALAHSAEEPASLEVTRRAPGRIRLRWDATRAPMVMVRDPVTGDVLSFARGGEAEVVTERDEVSLSVSGRVRSRDFRARVAPR